MARLGMFCPAWTGHLNPFCSLARELERGGHEIVFFQPHEFTPEVNRRGFRCEGFGETGHAAGPLAGRTRELARLEGLTAMRAGLDILTSQAEALFATAGPVIERAGLDLWIVDHLDYAASTLAAVMRARFVSLIVTLMRHREEGVPGFSGETYPGDAAALERDRRFNAAMLKASKPYRDLAGAYRARAGMGEFSFDTLWSKLAQITQQPEEFEFPRRELPACFHFTGPFARRQDRPATAFDWQRLDGRRLIYASFGTTQNRNRRLYEAVLRAAAELDAQVVLSLGGVEPAELGLGIPANVLAVPFAPQLEILERAELMITHAGMNSALECLAAGVPMVAVPIAHDQPGVAARIVWSGTGVGIPAAECEAEGLRHAVEQVLGESRFREAAGRFRRLIAERDGLARAAAIIERVAETGRRVLREEPHGGRAGPTGAAEEPRRRSR